MAALDVVARTPGRPLLLIASASADPPVVWDVR